MFTHVIFDLDGTLLNTIDDLADAGNYMCRQYGFPEHSVDQYKKMVGNGLRKLVERFVPEGTSQETQEAIFAAFKAYYDQHKEDKTAPYAGMPELVQELRNREISVAVLTNKADKMAAAVVNSYYPNLFPVVQGAVEGKPVKPDPTMLYVLMEKIGAKRESTLFVGDSNVDMQTAKNGSLTSCGVLWGFRTREELEREQADYLVETPQELLQLILDGNRK